MAELKQWRELPAAGALEPGEAAQTATGGWRTGERPEADTARCVDCLLCWLYCPDSAVLLDGKAFREIDLTFCKGCGICAEVCPTDAIAMVPE